MVGKRLSLFVLAVAVLTASAPGGVHAFPGSDTGGPEWSKHSRTSISEQVFAYVERLYIEPGRAVPMKLVENAVSRLETHYPEVLVSLDGEGGRASVEVDGKTGSFELPGDGSLNATAVFLDSLVDFIASVIDPPVEAEKLRDQALRGALSTLDPHTRLIAADRVGGFNVRTKGKFGGVGFTMSQGPDWIIVLRVLPRTPAEKMGLLEGDRILSVDGKSMEGMSTAEVVKHVRGDPGTEVTLTVTRDGWKEPRDLTVKREVIKIPSVESRLLGEGEHAALYLRLNRFQEDSGSQIREALYAAGDDAPAGVILDLRNNPGGFLDQAVSVADLFLDDGVILSTRNRRGISDVRRADAFGLVREQEPLVLLINRGSASASEVVSAALKSSRALVIGETSFGKGSVQNFYPLTDGGGLVLTIAHYLTPGDVSIQSVGVVPDILLNPVVVGEGGVQVIRRSDLTPEAELANAFSSGAETGGEQGRSLAVEFLRKEMDSPAAGLPAGHRASPADGEDFALGLATRILAAAGDNGRGTGKKGLLAAAVPVLESVSREEREKIEEAFADLDISWSRPSQPPAGGMVEGALEPDTTLEAGRTAQISLWVENTGESPLYRLWGRSSSGNPSLAGLDFAFGTLVPGERRSLSVDVDVPRRSEERWDPLEIHFRSAGGEELAVVSGGVRTEPVPHPELAYSFRITDTDREGESDGIIGAGEDVTVAVKVTNRGEGAVDGLTVSIRRGEGEPLSFGERSFEIDSLDGGATGEGTLSFSVPEGASVGSLDLSLAFSAGDYGLLLSDRLSLALDEPYPDSGRRSPPRLVIEPVELQTGEDSVSLEIAAEDDEILKDLYVYRGKKKIHYVRNREKSPRFPVVLKVPLDEGLNRIVVFARDQNETLARKTIYIFRSSPPV